MTEMPAAFLTNRHNSYPLTFGITASVITTSIVAVNSDFIASRPSAAETTS
jgi:hypothetical protein